MVTHKFLDGNEAAAWGAVYSRPDLVVVFPITPNTTLGNTLALLHARGIYKGGIINCEGEHTVMTICGGSSAAGARTFTSSSSQGIVYMEELIWAVAGYRLPIVMAICNRSIGNPGGLLPTHSDSLLQRDTGWLQIYLENAQEAFDSVIQCFKITEDERVYLPMIFAMDGYVLTSCAMPVEMPDQEEVDDFLPPYKHKYISLDPDNPPRLAPAFGVEVETEIRYQMEMAQENAKTVIEEVDREYAKRFGRSWGGMIEEYKTEGARGVLITMGSITGTARYVIDKMRAEGKPIGLVKLRSFRPFPTEELQEIGKRVEAIGFVDRNFTHGGAGGGGIGTIETARALYPLEDRPHLLGFIAGIGGRDVTPDNLRYMAEKVLKTCDTGKVEKMVEWVQLRA